VGQGAAREAHAAQEAAAGRPFARRKPIADLQARMASGRLSARQIAEAYLQRIERLDRSGAARQLGDRG
jgi:hypothetical protein